MNRFLVQHRMVDCLVTSAGGIEEDFIKYWICHSFFSSSILYLFPPLDNLTSCRCLAPTYLGAFDLPGKQLREKGINRYPQHIQMFIVYGRDKGKSPWWPWPWPLVIDQDRKPLGAEQQLRQVRRVADAHLGQVAGGVEQQWCCLDPEQDHPQVSTLCYVIFFWLNRDRLGLEINDESSIYYWAAKWVFWKV